MSSKAGWRRGTPVWPISSDALAAWPRALTRKAPRAAPGHWPSGTVCVIWPLPHPAVASGARGMPGCAICALGTRIDKTRPASWAAPCSARWTRCGSFYAITVLQPPIIGRNAPCVLLSLGVHAHKALSRSRAPGGSSASCRSKRPAVSKPTPPTPCWSTRSVATSTVNSPIRLGSHSLSDNLIPL